MKQLFDTFRHILGRGLTQSEVDAINAALKGETSQEPVANAPKEMKPVEGSNAFFRVVRKITRSLDQTQVDSINAILTQMQGDPVQWQAYALATAWHEARFKPQSEWGKGKGRRYGKPGKYGQIPYGRGLVQVTWDHNYERLDKEAAKAGLIESGEVLRNFDLALRPDIAVFALVEGMKRAWYASNGKPLSHYGPHSDGSFDYRRARQTVNVMDKADLIASHAQVFEKALRA